MAQHAFDRYQLERGLDRPQIAAIAFSGTIGIGIFVTSGELIAISGPVGCVIAYIWAGLIITGVMRSLAEMVSVRPVSGALLDYPHVFIDEAAGFSVGVIYCTSMAYLTAAAARAADNFPSNGNGISQKGIIGIIVGLCVITTLSNICGVRLYGNIERVVMIFKILLLVGVCVLMICIKAGAGVAYQMPPVHETVHELIARSQNGYAEAIVPYFRFTRYSTLLDLTQGGIGTGISGSWGQFLAMWLSTVLAMFSCMGGDLVIVAAGEARYPRQDLPKVAQFMYLVPLGFYVLATILLGMNINFLDPRLYHLFESNAEAGPKLPHSPFIIVAARSSIKVLPNFLNACFLMSAYTAGNTGLFVSSRTLFSTCHLYGNKWLKTTFGTTNNGHTPINAIFACAAFGLLTFLDLYDTTFEQPILTLASFFTGGVSCVYATECIAYLRFYWGITQLHSEYLDRDSDEYQQRHYRAHWQPLCAIFALFGLIMVILSSGWPSIYLLIKRNSLSTKDQLKSPSRLAADVVGAYSGSLLYLVLFIGYKSIYKTSFRRLRDFEDKYRMPEFDNEMPRQWRGWFREAVSYFIVDNNRSNRA
ncbi:amino acid permease/ SLC12A domain-containing protein [Amylocarpus encephaloides]|uniref:Amino acid permease/ SLC12A domain-containing protein n=1 Tax=Amylocarpus encephaloides TaxID=45428 RepID=A0A9P7YBB2_9HELO|nr:amino acid permease/ SLC12A domain-containing protein [Amylocarpus encephaloides]